MKKLLAALFGAVAVAAPQTASSLPLRSTPAGPLPGAASDATANPRQDKRGAGLSRTDADRLDAVADFLEQERPRGKGALRASAKKIRWMRRVADQVRHERFFDRRAA